MHADLWRKHMLRTFTANRHRTRDIYSASQQTRLAMDLVTGERTVAAPDAEIHVHNQQVGAVDDARRNLFFSRSQRAEVFNGLNCGRIVIGSGERCESGEDSVAQVRGRPLMARLEFPTLRCSPSPKHCSSTSRPAFAFESQDNFRRPENQRRSFDPVPTATPVDSGSRGTPRTRRTQPLLIRMIFSIGLCSWQSTWCFP